MYTTKKRKYCAAVFPCKCAILILATQDLSQMFYIHIPNIWNKYWCLSLLMCEFRSWHVANLFKKTLQHKWLTWHPGQWNIHSKFSLKLMFHTWKCHNLLCNKRYKRKAVHLVQKWLKICVWKCFDTFPNTPKLE